MYQEMMIQVTEQNIPFATIASEDRLLQNGDHRCRGIDPDWQCFLARQRVLGDGGNAFVFLGKFPPAICVKRVVDVELPP